MNMTPKEMLGQMLAFGFHGTTLSEEFLSLIREYKIGNIILFRRNVTDARQMRELCSQIQTVVQAETGLPAFILIDQEGGMVSRLPNDAVTVPCAMSLAATGDPENARVASEITIRQLKGLGANFNMAPVLDVNNNPQNPVIGIRSFGDRTELVSAFGIASAQPYENSGIICCGKHFPGHGDTAVDSHLGIPQVNKTEEELEQLELVPFRQAIAAGIPSIMISHVMFPHIEDRQIPCTMSRKIVTDLLKTKLGFKGLVLSDCMEMMAIQAHYGTPEGVVAALQAGVDIAEISSSITLQWATAKAVNEAAALGKLNMTEIKASVERIIAYKQQVATEIQQELCNLPADQEAVLQLTKKAITCHAGTPFVADADTFFCGCEDYRVSGVANDSASIGPFPAYMGKVFFANYAVTSKDPDLQEIQAVTAQAANHSKIVLATCNGHLFPGQIALAKALAETGKPLMVVALRNPYDLPLLPSCTCSIAAYDYTGAAFQALEAVLKGEETTGISPVAL